MSKKIPGTFISLEGTEGSGKSTLLRVLCTFLQTQGYSAVSTREPGGCEIGEKIRNLILSESMTPQTELFLYEAARAEHYQKVIQPALNQGKTVLCDRFTDSTLAYQSFARGLPWKDVQLLNKIATSGNQPELTVFLDIDTETGLKRVLNPNRFEAEGLEFQQKVYQGFLKARKEDPKRWLTLSPSDKTPEQLAQEVFFALVQRFPTRYQKQKE